MGNSRGGWSRQSVLAAVLLAILTANNWIAGTLPSPTVTVAASMAPLPSTGRLEISPHPQHLQQPPQDNDLSFESLSLEEGLSQSVVLAIHQDSRGFLWLGTQEGLNRYDGYQFVVNRHDPENPHSLSDSFVNAIVEDLSGALWIGTNSGGLNRFDRKTEQFTRYQNNPNDSNSLSSDVVLSLLQDRAGNLWVGTTGGLNRFDSTSQQFIRYQNDPGDSTSLSNDNVQSIYEDQAGRIWVGTLGGGLNRLDPETGQFFRYQNDPEDLNSLSGNGVQSIYEDQAGFLWIGTIASGLNRLDPQTGRFDRYRNDPADPHSLSDDNVLEVFEDGAGVLWIGTFDHGLDRFERPDGRFVHYSNDPRDPSSLSNDGIYSLYEDQAGVLWIGTFGGGVNKYDRHQRKFQHFRSNPDDPNSLSSGLVWSILEDREGVLWIGTAGGGLNRFERKTGQFTRYRHEPDDTDSLADDSVWALHEDREGGLWVGTGAGLDRFDRATNRFEHFPAGPIVFDILEDRLDRLWIGTWGAGLGWVDREAGQITYFANQASDPNSLNSNIVVCLYEDSDGTLWIGTFGGGLDHVDPGPGQEAPSTLSFEHYQNNPDDVRSLSHDTVLAINQSQAGVLWVGTFSGLNRFDPATETFIRYREKDGLPNEVIYGILEDKTGNLWMSTNRGLTRFDPRSETFTNFDTGDGLQSSEFNQNAHFRSESGEMFFGGINGFNAFYPDQVHRNPYVPPIVVTDFQLFNESVRPGPDSVLPESIAETDEIRLPYRDDFFAFEFAALHLSAPGENEYAYILEGLDKDWSYVGERRYARYTSVPPGAYVFRVKGSNSDGVWNEQGAAVRIIVTPPFWQTWWFRIAAAALVFGSIAGAATLRIRAVEAQRQQLALLVEERTKELQETLVELRQSRDAAEAANRAKSVFLTNISHELRTPLNAILGFSQLMNRKPELTPEQRENLQIINRSGEHLLGLINDVLEMSKIEAGRTTLNAHNFDLHHMVAGLEEMFVVRAASKGLALSLQLAPGVPRHVRTDEGKLRQILMNLLGNAVKFTEVGGVVLRVGVEGQRSEVGGRRSEVGGQRTEVSESEGGELPTADRRPPISDLRPPTSDTLTLNFSVRDTGPGIAPEEMATMFDPFVQTASGRQSQEGTGLGLAISRQFARHLGGDITATSQWGQGSVFRASIPVEVVDASLVPGLHSAQRVVGLEPGQPGYRLLVVDDNEVNRKLLVKLLGSVGFEVREATNGEEAIDAWEQWEPHLIWMDMRMPVMDGYSATRRIKSTVKGQATVIIALTASALEEDRAVMLSEGCDGYIRKPFQEAELFGALAHHLGVRFVSEALEPPKPIKPQEPAVASQGLVARLRALPPDRIADLHQATVRADLGRVLDLVNEIRGRDPALAEVLGTWAEGFEYQRILALVEAAGEQE